TESTSPSLLSLHDALPIFGLPAHLLLHRRPGRQGHGSGVDDCKVPAAPGRGRVEPVARDAWCILDNGFSLPNQPVEQRRFPNIGTADDGHDRFAHDTKNGGQAATSTYTIYTNYTIYTITCIASDAWPSLLS